MWVTVLTICLNTDVRQKVKCRLAFLVFCKAKALHKFAYRYQRNSQGLTRRWWQWWRKKETSTILAQPYPEVRPKFIISLENRTESRVAAVLWTFHRRLFLPGKSFRFSVANTYSIYCVDLVSTDSLRKPTLIQASNKKQRKGPVLTHEFKCYRTREQGWRYNFSYVTVFS